MLREALDKGRSDALARFKLAIAPPIAESPFAMPSFKGMGQALGRGFSAVGRGMRRAALPAALLGGGALAYGLHRQNVRDQQGRDLVYAPLDQGWGGTY